MTLFGNENVLDLSDQGLLEHVARQEQAQQEAPPAPDGPERMTLYCAAADAPPAPMTGERWQQATQKVAARWPQAEAGELIQRMVEIGQAQGDGQLWQKDPEGVMQQAALELYGLGADPLEQVVQAALLAGQQQQARQEREQQRRMNLAPSRLRQSSPAPVSPEQEILRGMAGARRKGIF